jgi:ATP-dependent exoDNAse (exonuclease V) beta subunit
MGKVQIIKASAGSGKTFRLALEYVMRVLGDDIGRPDKFRHILAVTFTNKATEEMKHRIIKELGKLSKKEESVFSKIICEKLNIPIQEAARRAFIVLTAILHDYTHFTVLTIDKFFQRIIRSFTHELGQDINYSIELHNDQIIDLATDIMLDNSNHKPELKRWLIEYIEERIANNNGWNPKNDIVNLGKQLFEQNIFDSDSRKLTKDLIRTCINSARKETECAKETLIQYTEALFNILQQHDLDVTDFYSGTRGFMNYFFKIRKGIYASPTDAEVRKVSSGNQWCTKNAPKKALIESLITTLQPMMFDIFRQINIVLKYQHTQDVLYQNYRTFAILPDLREAIDKYCFENSVLPIADTNKIIEGLVSNNDAPFIYEKIGNIFTDYMLDEFQDTSREQWANFKPLLSNALSQSNESNVLVVGDVKQSIYRWRGGDWKLLAGEVESQFNSESDQLKENYRSQDIVIQFNNELIESNLKNYPDGINNYLNNILSNALEQKSISESTYNELFDLTDRAYKDHKQILPQDKTPNKGYVSVMTLSKDSERIKDYKYLIECIEDVQSRGIKASEIAILVRKNKEGNNIAAALLEHKTKNPDSKFVYDIVTQEALLLKKSPAVRFIIALLNYIIDPNDLISKELVLTFSGLTIEQCDKLCSNICKLSPIRAIDKIIAEMPQLQCSKHIAYVQALHDNVISFSSRNTPDIREFLKWWNDNSNTLSISLSGDQNAINILTIHKSKGLQYKVVIIPECNWSMLSQSSIIWSRAKDSIAEELGKVPVQFDKISHSHFSEDYYRELVYSYIDNINMLYVAITRAEYELHIMLPEKKRFVRISQFIIPTLTPTNDGVSIGNLNGNIEVLDDNDIRYEFGTKYSQDEKSTKDKSDGDNSKSVIIEDYPTTNPWNKIKFNNKTEHILSKDGPTYSQRHYGTLMHSILELFSNGQPISQIVKTFIEQQIISEKDGWAITELLENALKNPIAKNWFSEDWTVVKSEVNIINPNSKRLRRPDRVMFRDEEAIVIDYKFGINIIEDHKKQVSRYMQSLSQMGYSNVKGYVWYVNLDNIIEVG